MAAVRRPGQHRRGYEGRIGDQGGACLFLLDSAVIAAARALGCRKLYSEDMSHGREIEGVTIINPFC
ncbi:MAG: hypothetical protein ABI906_02995 [Pseudomonadota bacterium]